MTVEIPDSDPRAAKVWAIVTRQPGAEDPIGTLWAACSTPQREVLVAIAEHREITQPELEEHLGIDGVALRGRNSGLAKIAKRENVDYPIRSTPGRRETRRFSLEPAAARQILRLNEHTTRRKKP